MGALTAYVHVRLCCSLCHHGRHAHRSLPRRNRQIYDCALPAGTKAGGRRMGERQKQNQRRWLGRKDKAKKFIYCTSEKMTRWIKEKKEEVWLSSRRAGEVSSPPPIREFGCSDVWLAVMADRQLAGNDMCWESSQRWANDRRGEAGRWLPSGKCTCSSVPVVWTETVNIWVWRE